MRDEQFETTLESLINGQRKQFLEQAEEYGPLDFIDDLFHHEMEYPRELIGRAIRTLNS